MVPSSLWCNWRKGTWPIDECQTFISRWEDINIEFKSALLIHSIEVRADAMQAFDFRIEAKLEGSNHFTKELAPNLVDGSGTVTVPPLEGLRLTMSFLDGFPFRHNDFKRRPNGFDGRHFKTDSFNDDYAIVCYRRETSHLTNTAIRCISMSKMKVNMITSGFCPSVTREMNSDYDHTLTNTATDKQATCATAAIMAGANGYNMNQGDKYKTISAFEDGDFTVSSSTKYYLTICFDEIIFI